MSADRGGARKKRSAKKRKSEAPKEPSPLREAIATALGRETELAAELEEARRKAGGKKGAALLLHAAGTLESALAETVSEKPSFLGRLAYGTAQLIGALATDDEASSRRFAELAAGEHVGIVFIDMVGFTAYTAANGDEAAVALVNLLEAMVSSICTLHEGEVVKHLGDGFLLAFGSAADAVRAAVALRDAARRKRDADAGFQQVRIAVHAGRPSVVREDLIGHDVNLTARLLERCSPGEVLVTGDAKLLAEKEDPSIGFADAGTVDLRDVPDPVATYGAV